MNIWQYRQEDWLPHVPCASWYCPVYRWTSRLRSYAWWLATIVMSVNTLILTLMSTNIQLRLTNTDLPTDRLTLSASDWALIMCEKILLRRLVLCHGRFIQSVILWDFQYDHCEYCYQLTTAVNNANITRRIFSTTFEWLSLGWQFASHEFLNIVIF